MSNNIQKVLKTTKEANAILTKAGGTMLKSSFNTAKEIAALYKNAGLKVFGLGKDIAKKTFELSLKNQKELLKTSGNALREVTQSIRVNTAEEKDKAKNNRSKSRKSVTNKKEVTIDDLLN